MISYFENLLELFIDMSFYIMLGLFFVGLLNTFIDKKWITSQIGSSSFWSVLKASLIGVPLPLCSCGVVPTSIELKKSGGSNGSVVSFLISTPQTGVDNIIATWGMLGPFMAIFRAVAAFISGVFGGVVVNIFGKNEEIVLDAPTGCHCESAGAEKAESSCCCGGEVKKAESSCCCSGEVEKTETSCCCSGEVEKAESSCCCSGEVEKAESSCCCSGEVEKTESSCCCSGEVEKAESSCCCSGEVEKAESSCCCSGEVEKAESSCCCSGENNAVDSLSFSKKIKRVFTYGFGSFLDEIVVHFVLGLLLSALISTIIPDDFFIGLGLDSGILSMLLMVVIGLPMYVCSTSSIPIAVSLVLKGLSPGAAFVFLFTGPVTNMASLTIILKTLGKKITALYVGSVIVASIGFGMVFDLICEKLGYSIASGELTHVHSDDVPIYFYVISAIFFALICKSLINRFVAKIKAK